MRNIIRITAVAAALLCSISAMGQTKVYCELLGTAKLLSNKVTISVDFGQENKFFSNQTLVDEAGHPLVFNSMVDAMNKMAELGWEFEQAYVVTIGGGTTASNVYHWLLSKYISDGETAGDGLKTYSAKQKELREAAAQEAQEAQQATEEVPAGE